MIRLILRYSAVCLSFSLFSPAALALQRPFDHSAWDGFLKKFVNEQGEIDYTGARQDPALLDAYEKKLRSIDGGDLAKNWPREESLALWLNAYHVAVLRAVMKHYPVKSINDIPGVWDMDFVKVGLSGHSINTVRTEKLLGIYRDEKIHTALCCGARGCPRMSREAFTGPRVEGQLFLAARRFVNDDLYNPIRPGEKKLRISKIFKWYGSDFSLDFGSAPNEDSPFSGIERAVISFLIHYLEDTRKIGFLESGDYKVAYTPFDWSLNEWRRGENVSEGSSGSPASR